MRTVLRGTLAAALVASAGCSLTIDPESVKPPAQGPAIALSTSALVFSATQGAAVPASQTVTVTSSGAGTLAAPTVSISYGSGTGWLTASVTGGAVPYTVTVQPSTTGLSSGTHTATVSVASAGASNTPRTISITYNLGSTTQPTIGLSAVPLTFSATQGGTNPASQAVTVTNSGTGTLAAPTASVSYGSGSGWLAANVTGSSAPYTVTVQASVGTLTSGTYTATVSIASAGASNTPQTFSVTFNVAPPPAISLSSAALTFSATQGGSNPLSQTVTVTNGGGGTLAAPTTSISYGSGTGWLAASVTGSSAPYTITLQPTVGTLVAGTYNATVSVSSAGASNTPRTIAVAFTVGSLVEPTISLSAASLTFSATLGGASPAAQAVTITNSGAGTLAVPTTSITYGSGTGWLTANVTGASAPYTITAQATLGILTAGIYTATVSVASTGASNTPQTFPVTFTVSAPPAISLSSASLTFSATAGGANPGSQAVTVTNSGGGTLATPTASITYGSGAGWLTATVSGAAAPYTITVQPSVGSLAAGSYSATVNVASAGASNTPQSISVTFDIVALPAIARSPTSLTFSATQGGSSPVAQTVQVTNAGGGTLALPAASVSYTSGSGWLTATVSGAAAPYTITVQPSVSGLTPATYNATVSVASVGASNSPQLVTVSFQVFAPTPAAGGCIASSGHKVCAGTASAGGAERLSSATHGIRRSTVEAGGAAKVQSASHQIARSVLSPGTANP